MADTPPVNPSAHNNLEYIGSVVAGVILLATWAYIGLAAVGEADLSAIPKIGTSASSCPQLLWQASRSSARMCT